MTFEEVIPNSETSLAAVTIKSTDLPYPRSGHRMVAYGTNIYAIGGYNPELWQQDNNQDTYYPLFKEVWCFSIITRKWTKLETNGGIPVQLASHSAVVHENYLLVFGGTGIPFGQSSSNDLHALNLRTLTWTRLPCSGFRPFKQYGHAMVLHGDDLFIIGGTSGFEYNMDVFRLNLKDPKLEWEKLNRNTCKARYRHEAIFSNNSLIVFGGGTASEVCPLAEVDVFDISTRYWRTMKTKPDPTFGYPAPRRCHGLARFENYVHITGGTDGRSLFDDIWRYDIDKNSWTKRKTCLPKAVFFHSTTVTQKGCLYSFGGVLNGESTERSSQLYRVWLAPSSLHNLALEKINSMYPDFKIGPIFTPLAA